MPTSLDPYGYDELPYPSAPYPYTHPDHLATLASLFGLNPPDIRQARILEVGCADGANLIPLAIALPHSRLVGVDLSGRQIQQGQFLANHLRLTNLDLRHNDFTTWTDQEPFDYVIAHGFYSWTPPATRDGLLAFCSRSLSAHGVAFISYNVFPGWQKRFALRQWLRGQDAAGTPSPDMNAVRRRLSALQRACQADTTLAHVQDCAAELEQLLRWSDAYLRHDLLEDHNQPVTFGEFSDHLHRHGLRFLCEADLPSSLGADLTPPLAAQLKSPAHTVRERESLIDLLTQRTFRQAVVCRETAAAMDTIQAARLRTLCCAVALRETATAPQPGDVSATFTTRTGGRIVVDHPGCAAAIRTLLRAWPHPLPLADVVHTTLAASPPDGPTDSNDSRKLWDALTTHLLEAYAQRSAVLHTVIPQYAVQVAPFPRASELARWQAARQTWVTTLRHDLMTLTPDQRQQLIRLDGHTPAAELPEQLLHQFLRWALLLPER